MAGSVSQCPGLPWQSFGKREEERKHSDPSHCTPACLYTKKGTRNSQRCHFEDVMEGGSLLRVPLAEKSAVGFLSTSWQLLLLLWSVLNTGFI